MNTEPNNESKNESADKSNTANKEKEVSIAQDTTESEKKTAKVDTKKTITKIEVKIINFIIFSIFRKKVNTKALQKNKL